MGLQTYQRKRIFTRTAEPKGKVKKADQRRFVVQEHHASQLHYDFRLEMGGVLKSWAVPKGLSLNPRHKRLAVMVEDHPVEYLHFAGAIAEGNYGAGDVRIWDSGRYELSEPADPLQQLETGKLSFLLYGKRLRGEFHLIRMKNSARQWLLIKSKDVFATAAKTEIAQQGLAENSHGRPHSLKSRKAKASRRKGVKLTSEAPTPIAQPFGDNLNETAAPIPNARLQGDLTVPVQRSSVLLTHLDKLYWPEDDYSKGDLIRYYVEISSVLLPYLRDRPLILQRYPNGISGASFYQHDVDAVPHYVRTFSTPVDSGKTVDYAVCNNLATLLYLSNLGTIAQNPWHSRLAHIDHPDWIVFDLDPHGADFAAVQNLALGLKDLLDRLGLASYPKTSGASGMHVYVPLKPLYSYEHVARFAELVARQLAEDYPQLGTLTRSLKKRVPGQIYLDHLQNARGKSMVAPYSARAVAGARVSAPVTWAEVSRPLNPQAFTIATMPQRLAQVGDLFTPVLRQKQRLGEAIERLGALLRLPRHSRQSRNRKTTNTHTT